MTMSKLKAAMKKLKLKNYLKKTENDCDSDDDGSITSDDVDLLEDDYLGNVIENQYIIIKYVGRGTFSRVWLLYDLDNSKFIIFKVYFPDEIDEFKYEVTALQKIKENKFDYNLNYYSSLNTVFETDNDKKQNPCLLLPYMGLSLADIMDYKKVLSVPETKHIIKHILLGLKELHSVKFVHTDLKLDNILTDFYHPRTDKFIEWFKSLNIQAQYNKLFVMNTPAEFNTFNKNKKKLQKRKIKNRTLQAVSLFVKKKINEYLEDTCDDNSEHNQHSGGSDSDTGDDSSGDSDYTDESSDDDTYHIGETDIHKLKFTITDYSNAIHIDEVDVEDEYQIRAYRAPENIMCFNYTYKSELWAVGCLMWDLLTDNYIFEPELTGDYVSRDRAQLALMEKVLGRVPKDMSLESDRSYELFEESGRIKKHRKVEKIPLEEILKEERDDLTDDEVTEVCGFLKSVWSYNPKMRLSVDEALAHPFLN